MSEVYGDYAQLLRGKEVAYVTTKEFRSEHSSPIVEGVTIHFKDGTIFTIDLCNIEGGATLELEFIPHF